MKKQAIQFQDDHTKQRPYLDHKRPYDIPFLDFIVPNADIEYCTNQGIHILLKFSKIEINIFFKFLQDWEK